MALRWPLETHFELYCALVANWLSDGLWRLILSSSGLWWPNGSQMASPRILQYIWLSRVGLQWVVENAPGKQDLSLFTVLPLTWHVSRVLILQYIPHRTLVSPFPRILRYIWLSRVGLQ